MSKYDTKRKDTTPEFEQACPDIHVISANFFAASLVKGGEQKSALADDDLKDKINKPIVAFPIPGQYREALKNN